jgi:hypothetical protein
MKTRSAKSAARLERIDHIMPKPYQEVIVMTEHFSCLGFSDSSGAWYSAKNRAPLEKVVKWQHLQSV